MRPDTAVRQLEYAVASQLDTDSWGHWEANMYGDVFERLAEDGTQEDVGAVIDHICDGVQDGCRPKRSEVREYADTLLTEGGRPLTDGGD